MGLFRANGQRITRSSLARAAEADPLQQITEDVYEKVRTGREDDKPEGTLTRVKFKAGAVLRQSQIDVLFRAPSVTQVAPAEGPAVGGTVVTITGLDLDGVTAVTFDGVAGTALTKVSDRELTVTSPAGTAGPADLVLTGDTGNVTEAAAFTYA